MGTPSRPPKPARQTASAGRWTLLAFTLLVLYLTHLFHLGTLPLVGADEPRYARIGEEMWRSGDFITPTLNGAPWLEKPPLLYWLQAASYAVFGVSEWSARLPSALLSLFCVATVAGLLVRVDRPRAARLVLLMLPTAPLYVGLARSASTDMPLAACLAVALAAAYLAAREGGMGWAVGSGAALALAVLAKGPVAVVLFAGIILAYRLLARRPLWTVLQIGGGMIVFGLLAAPWFWLIWRATGYDFLVTFVINHHVARYLTEIHRHSQPFWFYGPVLLAGFFPWIFLLGSALRRLPRQWSGFSWERPPLQPLLWLWLLVPLVFFSVSSSKLAGYILPVFPALAMLCALEWDRFVEGDVTARRSVRGEVALMAVFGGLLSAGLVVGSVLFYEVLWAGLLLAAPIAAGLAAAWIELRRRRSLGVVLHLSAAMTMFVAAAYWLAAPVVGPYHSLAELAAQARPGISPEAPLIQYRTFHHTALYYTDYQATPDALGDRIYLSNYFAAFPQERYFLITKGHALADLVTGLVQLESITRSGPFYLIEYVPPEEGTRNSGASTR